MRILEVLPIKIQESISRKTTVDSIVGDINNSVNTMFDGLKQRIRQHVDNEMSLEKYHGAISMTFRRWFETIYVDGIKPDLYDLCREYPEQTSELKYFLRMLPRSYMGSNKNNDVGLTSLPNILIKTGKAINNPKLVRAAQFWYDEQDSYFRFIDDIEDEIDEYNADREVQSKKSGHVDRKGDTVRYSAGMDNSYRKTIGAQNSQVDSIVNDVLSKIPKEYAGAMRNAISKSGNKLQTLQDLISKYELEKFIK